MARTMEDMMAERSRKHAEAVAWVKVIEARLRHPEYETCAKQAGTLQRLLVSLAALDNAIGAAAREGAV